MDSVVSFLQAIWNGIKSFFTFIQDAFDYFWKLVTQFPEWVFSKIAKGIVAFFNVLPVPSFFTQASSAFSSVPASVLYFTDMLQIGPGITMLLSAYLLRFIVRRLPVVG